MRTAWYAVRPASASAATSAGARPSSSLTTDRTPVRMKLGHPPVAAETRELRSGTVHVVTGTARPAQAARHQRVQDDLVPDGHRADGVTHGDHRAGVLVADDVGQLGILPAGPLALDDVQVGAAHAGRVDVHQDVERTLDGGLGHVVEAGRLAVVVDANCLHGNHLMGRRGGDHRP